jgi:alkylated DNA repair dioxygenase AlkB
MSTSFRDRHKGHTIYTTFNCGLCCHTCGEVELAAPPLRTALMIRALFPAVGFETVPLRDADVRLWRGFLPLADADALFSILHTTAPWKRHEVVVYGRPHRIPRKHAWFADDPDWVYRWSGLRMEPHQIPGCLRQMQRWITTELGCDFPMVLANLYRDGQDRVGWHSDDETEMGNTIASVSLGASRDFQLRPTRGSSPRKTTTITLHHGDLLVMAGDTQDNYQHQIPRRARVTEPRINLTWRSVSGGLT